MDVGFHSCSVGLSGRRLEWGRAARPLCFRWHLFLRDSPRRPRLATSSFLRGLVPPGSSHYGSNPCLWVAPPGLPLLFQLPAGGHFSWLLCWSPGQPCHGGFTPSWWPGLLGSNSMFSSSLCTSSFRSNLQMIYVWVAQLSMFAAFQKTLWLVCWVKIPGLVLLSRVNTDLIVIR